MLRSTLIIGLMVFAGSASAEGLNYTYLQASWGQVDFDDSLLDVDGDGFGIAGSVAISENFHVFGEYQTADLDFSVDLNILEAGLGYNVPLSETVDFVARLGYVNIEAEAPGVPSADEDGYSAGVGLRGNLSNNVELDGGVDYVDGSDTDGETRVNAGFRYNFTENFSVGAKGTWWEDVNIYQLNARFSF